MSAEQLDTPVGPVAIGTIRRPFNVTIRPPGSKSQTNRYLMLAALSRGVSRLSRPLRASDPDLFMKAIEQVGVGVDITEDSVAINARETRPNGDASVNLGDGGTPTRFMIAIASLARKPVVIDGSPRMRQRPIAEGVEMLRALGGRIEYVEEEGRLPVRVGGGRIPTGGAIEVGRTASSQFVSAMLLLAARLERGVDMFVTDESLTSPSYVELTVEALTKWGVTVDLMRDSLGRIRRITVPHQPLVGQSVSIEPDASSAVYFLAAAAIVRDARVTISGLPRLSRQPDAACLAALVSMGAQEWSGPLGMGIEGTATLNGIDVDASRWPDGALCIGAVAALARGRSRIRGLETLKVKESNRVEVLVEELRRMGCAVESTATSLSIDPDLSSARPIVIDPRGDHRVAMSFAVMGLVRPGISIADPGCVAKSYPGFWRDFARLGETPRG